MQDARGVLLTPELAQEELAEMIGSSRPMVSRLIAEMMDQRIIARQGKHFILLNKPAARGVAEPGMKATKSFAKSARGCSPIAAAAPLPLLASVR